MFWGKVFFGEGNGERRRKNILRRTRISCFASLDAATYAAFIKESRMEFANATRKSGRAVP